MDTLLLVEAAEAAEDLLGLLDVGVEVADGVDEPCPNLGSDLLTASSNEISLSGFQICRSCLWREPKSRMSTPESHRSPEIIALGSYYWFVEGDGQLLAEEIEDLHEGRSPYFWV